MQIKEYQANTLKECLQQVRNDLGPEAVILETRKVRKGGVLGLGAREAVCIVAAIGISVKEDIASRRSGAETSPAASPTLSSPKKNGGTPVSSTGKSALASAARSVSVPAASKQNGSAFLFDEPAYVPPSRLPETREERCESGMNGSRAVVTSGQSAAIAAARNAYARAGSTVRQEKPAEPVSYTEARQDHAPKERAHTGRASAGNSNLYDDEQEEQKAAWVKGIADERDSRQSVSARKQTPSPAPSELENTRFAVLEQAMQEIRQGLSLLQREQQESQERTISAVVSAVAPALTAAGNAGHLSSLVEAIDTSVPRFPELYARLTNAGVSPALAHELLDALPDFSAWSDEAQPSLAVSALRDLISRRVSSAGPIDLTPGTLKAVALIGPTGVGKTTTIAKLAAHFALVEKKRVALLTMDTYRIAAVEQLKIYSQIIDIPVGVAYSQAEVAPVIAQYADFDLLLIDTAGRSQKNIMQVGELKSLLEIVGCETHLVLSAQTKEQDMIEAAQRFSAARVDRIIFSKLDETDSYGTLLNVADRTGFPLSYLTTGQKVPEDLELADGGRLASLLLS